jgi:cold shock CspA family protein
LPSLSIKAASPREQQGLTSRKSKRTSPSDKSATKKTYKHPIPGRSELLATLTEFGRPMKTDQIMAALGLKGQKTRGLLADQLQKMLRGGQIIENRRGEYCLTQKLELIAGTVLGHRDGFGFVRRDDSGDDIYLSAREMRSVFDGDRVAVRIVGLDKRGRAEGRVVEVLERGMPSEEPAGSKAVAPGVLNADGRLGPCCPPLSAKSPERFRLVIRAKRKSDAEKTKRSMDRRVSVLKS